MLAAFQDDVTVLGLMQFYERLLIIGCLKKENIYNIFLHLLDDPGVDYFIKYYTDSYGQMLLELRLQSHVLDYS